MSTVNGIGGIFFKSENPKELGAWYDEHLGMSYKDSVVVFGSRRLDRPAQVAQTVWSPFSADTTYFEPSGASFMLNYRVDDLDAALARLRDEGVNVLDDREDSEWGRFGWILDPENNKIELWEPPPNTSGTTVPAVERLDLPGVWATPPGTTMAATGDLSDRKIQVTTTLDRPVEEVWKLWTTSAGMAQWWAPENSIDLAVGGPMELYFLDEEQRGPRGSENCRILSFLPQKMLSFTWNAPPKLDAVRPYHTHVVIEFNARKNDACQVVLHHLGWPEAAWDDEPQWADCFRYFEAAWPKVLDRLQSFAKNS